jgi:hypothetical protein
MLCNSGTNNRYYEETLRREIEGRFGCPIDYIERRLECFDRWRVYSIRGQMMEIDGDWALHLSGGLSNRMNRVVLARRCEIDYSQMLSNEISTNDYRATYGLEQEDINKYVFGNFNACQEEKTIKKPIKKDKLNKLKLLYWSYFNKHNEKAF